MNNAARVFLAMFRCRLASVQFLSLVGSSQIYVMIFRSAALTTSLVAVALAAAPTRVQSVLGGKTFGGTWHGVVSFEFTFNADGTALSPLAMWGSQPFQCDNLTVVAVNDTAVRIDELDSWNHLDTKGGLCVANGITTNAVSFAPVVAVGPVISSCGEDPLNVCTSIILQTSSGPVFLLHQSFPIANAPKVIPNGRRG